MWKIFQSKSSAQKIEDSTVYTLQFSDKPMYVSHIEEGCSTESIPRSLRTEDSTTQHSHSDDISVE